MTQFIGLSGYARAGKDSVASALVQHLGFIQVSFADKLKSALKRLDPIIGYVEDEHGLLYLSAAWDYSLSDAQNWEMLKSYGEVRRLLQYMGTEVGRRLFGENFWVDQAFASIPANASGVVFSDCRFPQEAQAVVDRGGMVWRIERPGYGPVNNHASETSLDDWPFDNVLHNDGNLLDLQETAMSLLDRQHTTTTSEEVLTS